MFKENMQIVVLSIVTLVLTACASTPKKSPVLKQPPITAQPSGAINKQKTPIPPIPVGVKKKPIPRYMTTLKEGDLLSNLKRVTVRYNFRLVWELTPYNYHVIGNTKIYADSFDKLIKQLVQNYPVKVKIYTKNKVVVVMPEYDLQMSQPNNE